MIYTLTISPSIDYVVEVDNFKIGNINRAKSEHAFIGGKGINVSLVLHNLGRESTALGFIAGFTGRHIKEELDHLFIKNDFVELEGLTRINVKLIGEKETAINGIGPSINEEDIETLIQKIERLNEEDYLIMSGAIPSLVNKNIYEEILKRISPQVHVVIDTASKALLDLLKYHPFLTKPNKEELEELFDVVINNDDELVRYAKRLIELGAKNVIVSLDKDGALLVNKDIVIKSNSPKGTVINSVGAGDSLIAGFIDQYLRSKNIVKAFYYGIASGSASAFSNKLATKEEIDYLYSKVNEWK